jgi:hypothetical protein
VLGDFVQRVWHGGGQGFRLFPGVQQVLPLPTVYSQLHIASLRWREPFGIVFGIVLLPPMIF